MIIALIGAAAVHSANSYLILQRIRSGRDGVNFADPFPSEFIFKPPKSWEI